MIPCGPIITELCDQVNDPRSTADAVWKAKVLTKLNEAYREVALSYTWSTLQSVSTLEDAVYRLPADCYRVLRVIDEDKQKYNYVGGKNMLSSYRFNWYWDTPVSTALASGTTLVIQEYSKSVSSTAEFPSSDCADEYIRIGSNPGLYKIASWTSTSDITLSDYFRGAALSSAGFSIRPVGTQVLAFSDAAGEDKEPDGVEVTYMKFPLPLWRDEDIIELPGDCGAVRIRALQKILALVKRDWEASRMQVDYMAALGMMKVLEPKVPEMKPNSLFVRRTLTTTGDLHDRLVYG